MKSIRKKAVRIMLLFAWTLFFLYIDTYAASGNTTRIHFISLYEASDAILLESNGHFGMVDSGEDWDYPSGSTGSKYPYRYGITTNEGYEQQVVHYLKQLGVEKLDFYIATHAHSDHIGSGSGRRRYGEDCRTGKESKDRLVKIAASWDGIITIHRIS